MYLTISKFKQVLRSRKGLDYNTDRRIAFVIRDVVCYNKFTFPQNIQQAKNVQHQITDILLAVFVLAAHKGYYIVFLKWNVGMSVTILQR